MFHRTSEFASAIIGHQKAEDALAKFLELIEYNLKHGSKTQQRAARELLLRYLEGKLRS